MAESTPIEDTRLRAHGVLHGLGRLRHIVAVLVRHAAAHLLARRPAGRWAVLRRHLPLADLDPPRRLRALFEDLGGAFLKFGQMLALQPDVLGPELCNALLELLDRIEPFAPEHAERILREELGAGSGELFDSFDARPLATASVGQVYRATVGGSAVAVKVQRPDVEIEFRNDVRLMVAVGALIRTARVRSWQWLVEPMGEFVAWSREELDYRYEARYATALRRNAASNPLQHVPRVHDRFTTRRTLVADFVDGVSLLDYLRAREAGDQAVLDALAEGGFDPRRFAANVVSNFLGDAFRYGVYHADLHPANLMILDDNVVGYVDFGITGVMSRDSRRHLVAMSLGLARGDLEAIYSQYLEITVHDERSDYEGFRAELEERAPGWYRNGPDGRRLEAKVTRIFSEMLDLSRRHRVMPERDIVKYIRSSIAIDGLLARFSPGYDIGSQIAERCTEFLRHESHLGRMSPDRMLDWWSAGVRLLADGHALPDRLLARTAARPRTGPRSARRSPRPWRPLVPASAAVLSSALFVLTPGSPGLGLNLWTAELVMVGACSLAVAAAAGPAARMQRRRS